MDWSRLKEDRTLVAINGAGTAIFVVSFAISAALYPGGTWWNRRAPGHSLELNFLCDLMQTRALNGEPAPVGSLLARVGTFAILVGLVAFYAQIAKLESPVSRAGRLALRSAWLACAVGCSVPIITSDMWRLGHLISVVAAFVPSQVATAAALVVCLRAPRVSWWIRGFGLLTLGSAVADGLLYIFVYTSPALGLVPDSFETRILINRLLPLLQRVAMVALIGWVLATCVHTMARVRRAKRVE